MPLQSGAFIHIRPNLYRKRPETIEVPHDSRSPGNGVSVHRGCGSHMTPIFWLGLGVSCFAVSICVLLMYLYSGIRF